MRRVANNRAELADGVNAGCCGGSRLGQQDSQGEQYADHPRVISQITRNVCI